MIRSLRSARTMLLPVALLFAAGGCTQDPFERPGTWQPVGANDRNLRAMVANPNDLARGQAAITDRGNAGANAVTRLLVERRRPLPALQASSIGATQQQADQPLAGLGGGTNGGAAR